MVSPGKTWLITDTHFNHNKLIECGDRPPDFTDRIIRQWRSKITSQDLVFHLGDVILGQAGQLGAILGNLPGTKVLIVGNHDTQSYGWYRRKGFTAVLDAAVYDRVLLTHFPQAVLPDNALLNVHGHLHGNGHRHGEFIPMPWHRLLALENTGYSPVEFKSFVGPLAGDSFSRVAEPKP